tara:strand:+ start:691 stop:846 length:156 start_codon:yes stop_codon:yes gene_type:complete
MANSAEKFTITEETDAIDSYFQCITACSLDDEGMDCVTRCVEVHLKEEVSE